MKVLVLSGEYPPVLGGVGDYTAILMEHLLRLGVEATVLTTARCPARPDSDRRGQPVVLRELRDWGFGSWPIIAAHAQQLGCQLVHLQYQAAAYSMKPAVNLLPFYLRARIPSAKVVTTFHDLRVPYLFPKAGPLRKYAIRTLDLLSHGSIATNQDDLDALAGTFEAKDEGGSRRRLIPIGSNIPRVPPLDFDRSDFRRQLGVSAEDLLVSHFGFMNHSKGVDCLIEALRLLKDRGVCLRLAIVGGEAGGSDPSNVRCSGLVKRSIESYGLSDQVVWTGFLPPELVSAYLLSSDLCALPFRDGASLRRGSLLAALAHGLPVVTTLPDRSDPMLVDGENLAMVPRDNPRALAQALDRLWGDPNRRRRLSDGAEKLAARFQWPAIASRHLEMYEGLVSDRQ